MQSGSEQIIRKFIPLSVMMLMIISGLLYLFYHNRPDYTSVFFSLDTVVSVRSDSRCTDEIKKQITDLSDIFDNYSSSSEITELNNKKELNCSSELAEFINEVLELSDTYGKRADISAGKLTALWKTAMDNKTLPDEAEIQSLLKETETENISVNEKQVTLLNDAEIDPGAAAKGYVLDRVYSFCLEYNPGYAIVSTGSSTLLYSSDESHIFNVAVKSDHENIAGTAETGPCFVSTSGDYERFAEINGKKYHHIIDTKTGYPADSGLSSVTVFCSSGIMSDFLSTLIFIEGKENLDRYLDSDDFRIIAIDNQGNIFKSDSLIFHESE